MKQIIQKLFLYTLLLLEGQGAFAQVQAISPEVQKMYRNAQEYASRGNYKDAITVYKQAIALAPGMFVLYRELGGALYLSGKYKEAEDVLEPLAGRAEGDTQCYRLLAASQTAQQRGKQAIVTLRKGIDRFPGSGVLYHETGKIYADENDKKNALNMWLDGVEKDPAYSENYYDAAMLYLSTEKVMWGILYGEMFLAMQHDVSYDATVKNELFAAYKVLFDNIAKEEVPKYGTALKHATVNTFMDAVQNLYKSLTPVVSDGITTETLTMLRVRFLMEWFSRNEKIFPFSFFSYQDKVIKSGRFDVYNEWLFGNAESTIEYNTWTTFHEGDMQRFLQWRSANLFVPATGEFYNDRDMDGMFGKKKK